MKVQTFQNIMGELLNDWIQLFDEKNFQRIHDEPNDLKAIIMLFVTLQKEFQKLELTLDNKLKKYKDSLASKCTDEIKREPVNEIIYVPSSPEKNFKSSVNKIGNKSKSLLKSPVIDRHRKMNMKKPKKTTGSPNKLGVLSRKNNEYFSTKKTEKSNKVILPASDDDDLFNATVIGGTPNTGISKRIGSLYSPKKKGKTDMKSSLSDSTGATITQLFSKMTPKEHEKIDETSMMDIDEILETVANAEKISEPSDETKISQGTWNTKKKKIYNSFIEEYDKLPKSKEKPVQNFVYKETVRGNEKKKLKGWSCKDCEKFYDGMKLSEEELEKKMNECSKHRSKFKPDDDTIPGYWDLSIPSTPEDEKTPPASPRESQDSFNESTIFCFYKK